jgi:hypothetical protein
VPAGALVLDAGAGRGPYRKHFARHRYESSDFEKVAKEYQANTYVCDLTAVPVEDGRFDLVLLTQVLEHLPEPIAALKGNAPHHQAGVQDLGEHAALILREDGGEAIIEGRVVPYGEWSEVDNVREGRFLERFLPGSLAKTFQRFRQLKVYFEHGRSQPF